jgi:hypothetical protein
VKFNPGSENGNEVEGLTTTINLMVMMMRYGPLDLDTSSLDHERLVKSSDGLRVLPMTKDWEYLGH